MRKDGKETGMRAAIVGIVCNFLLAAIKIAAGGLSMLVSVVADGINNLSDCGSGLVALVSMHVSHKPADKEHPYGHRRAEYIASMIVGFLVLALAAELLITSAENIIKGTNTGAALWVYGLLALSVAVKGGMFFYYRAIGKRIGSDVLLAAAKDSGCDVLATSIVMAGLLCSNLFSFSLDAYLGVLVALFIVWEGIGIIREESSKLLGRAPDPALLDKIRTMIAEGEGVLGCHDLRLYNYGEGHMFATVHVEMDANRPVLALHEILDGLERKIAEQTGVALTAHLDPIDPGDEERTEAEKRVRGAIEGMYEGMNVHDFRLVHGAKNKVVFEVGVPFDCKEKDAEIENNVCRAVRLLGDWDIVVTVERM